VANDGGLHRKLLKTWTLRRHDRLPRSKESASDAVLGSTEFATKEETFGSFAYRTPRFEYGEVVTCEMRGDVKMVGLTAARIPWPKCPTGKRCRARGRCHSRLARPNSPLRIE
jgi:hypothetical protein